MIRRFETEDLNSVLSIWLEGNIQAHQFIPKVYWKKNLDFMKNALPEADVYVYEYNGVIVGFIGLNENYIAGIFVEESYRSRGIGRQLIDFIKEPHSTLTLNVYSKNEKAIRFYTREGFIITEETIDSATEESEYLMVWTK